MLAQGIAPPIAEYRSVGKIDGSFEIQNPADYPVVALLEARSFSVDDHGQVVFRPLDKGIDVRMGSNSFMLRAHDKHIVFYKATFPSSPMSFCIVTTVTKAGALTGMRLNFIFPHMIYVYQKEKLGRSDINLSSVDGVLRITNLSDKLGRVEGVHSAKEELGGFPLYPRQTREVPITGEKISVKFEDGFKVELR